MASEIYIPINKLVSEKQKELISLVVHWSFISAGPPFESKKYDGSLIRYQGIKFQGSPQMVFWSGYIEPYLENYGLEIIETIGKSSYESGIEIEAAIKECISALNNMVLSVYNQMAEVDSRLLGNGSTPTEMRNVSGMVESMQNTLNGHATIIQKKYIKMQSDKHQAHTTNNFNAPVQNAQTGNKNIQNNTHAASSNTFFQWVMDHLVSVIVASVIAGVILTFISGV